MKVFCHKVKDLPLTFFERVTRPQRGGKRTDPKPVIIGERKRKPPTITIPIIIIT
jgi:hypothetical protein